MARRKIQSILSANGVPPIIRALRQGVDINIEGKVWPIVFDFNVMIELQNRFTVDGLAQIHKDVREMKPHFEYTRAAFYYCLKYAGAPYDETTVGTFINAKTLPVIQEALLRAEAAGLSGQDEDEQENPIQAAAT